MRHPDSDTQGWALTWFAKYALLFGIPLLFLLIAFHDDRRWFFGLALYWTCAIAFFAWRAMSAQVTLRWRIGLAAVILASLGYCTLAVLAGPGDTVICYDRLRQPHRWAPIQNLGPDPYCRGVPLDAVETGTKQ